jgi:hypothetical protein
MIRGEPLVTYIVDAMAVGQVAGVPVAVTAGTGWALRVQDLRTGAARELIGHYSGFSAIALGEVDGGSVAVSGHDDGAILIWSLDNDPRASVLMVAPEEVTAIAFAGEIGWLTLTKGGNLFLWHQAPGTEFIARGDPLEVKEEMPPSPRPEHSTAADAIILQERRARVSIPFILLLAGFIAALARGIADRQAASVLIFGALAALTVWRWVLAIRGRGRLEIAGDAITHVGRRGRPVALNRQQGGMLRVIRQGSPVWGSTRWLTIQGTAPRIPLNLFKLSEVRRACTARGWQFQ